MCMMKDIREAQTNLNHADFHPWDLGWTYNYSTLYLAGEKIPRYANFELYYPVGVE